MQHTSFLAGGPITSAGTLKVTDGVVTSFSPMSGHYRTTADSFEHFIQELKARGADLSEVKISKTKFTLWLYVKLALPLPSQDVPLNSGPRLFFPSGTVFRRQTLTTVSRRK